MLVFMGFVSCLRRTHWCGDEHETKSMDAMIVKSAELLFRDLGLLFRDELRLEEIGAAASVRTETKLLKLFQIIRKRSVKCRIL